MTPAERPPRRRGRPPIYANPTIREREKKRRQRAKMMERLRRAVGLERLAAARYEFEHPTISHISLDDALADPEIGPEIGPTMTDAARIQRGLEMARGPKEFAKAVERLGGPTRVSRALRTASRELDELNAACTAAPCPNCGNALILEDLASFVAGDAVFVTCPRCSTVRYFGPAVAIPIQQRRELGAPVSVPMDDEPPALALSRAAGGMRSMGRGGTLGSGGTLATDRAYKREIEAVLGRSISWRVYNERYRPRTPK